MSRTVAFPPDGKRRIVTVAEVVAAWSAVSSLHAQYAIGTANHESDRTINEVDVEPSGFTSRGIFQISDEELKETALTHVDVLTLDGSCDVLSALAAYRLTKILAAARVEGTPRDAYAFLSIAHNQGLAAAVKSIKTHGLDWPRYKHRNGSIVRPGFNGPAICRYGDDCMPPLPPP